MWGPRGRTSIEEPMGSLQCLFPCKLDINGWAWQWVTKGLDPGAAAMEGKQRAALKSVCVLGAGLFTDLKDVPELCLRLTGGGACLACSRPWVQSSILGRTNVFGGWQRWQTAAGKSQAANLRFAAQMVSRTVTNNM